MALDNARLYEDSLSRAAELDERSQRLALLNHFSSSLSGLLEAGQILELTAQELRQALNADRASAVVMEHNQPRWKVASPGVGQPLPRRCRKCLCSPGYANPWASSTPKMQSSEADLLALRGFIQEDVKSLLVLPLISGQELRALVFVQDPVGAHFSLTGIELARTIASQASIALENARLYKSTVRTAERFAILKSGQCRNRREPRPGGDLRLHPSGGRPSDAGRGFRHQPAG